MCEQNKEKNCCCVNILFIFRVHTLQVGGGGGGGTYSKNIYNRLGFFRATVLLKPA
jgi:hypothetical protein